MQFIKPFLLSKSTNMLLVFVRWQCILLQRKTYVQSVCNKVGAISKWKCDNFICRWLARNTVLPNQFQTRLFIQFFHEKTQSNYVSPRCCGCSTVLELLFTSSLDSRIAATIEIVVRLVRIRGRRRGG